MAKQVFTLKRSKKTMTFSKLKGGGGVSSKKSSSKSKRKYNKKNKKYSTKNKKYKVKKSKSKK